MLSQEFNKLIYDYRVVIFLLFCLTTQVISWRMWLRLQKGKVARRIIHMAFVIFNLGWFFTVGTLYYGGNLTDFTWLWIGRPSVSWQVVYIFGILPLAVAGSLIWGICGRIKKRKQGPAFNEKRRNFLKAAGGTAGALAILGTCGYGVIRQSLPPNIKRHNLSIKGLPAVLDGFTIAHITDLHLGLWASQAELYQAFRLVAAQKPDLVAFTGDQVDRSADNAKLYYRPLEYLNKVPHGVWGVLGNHDHYTGAPLRVAKYLTEGGLTILVDRQVNLPNLPISLIGLDDQGIHHSWMGGGPSFDAKDDPDVLNFDLVAGPAPRPEDFTILLNHRPEGFAQAAARGCRLYLAGHTHGGQYQVPFKDQMNLAAAFYKYSSGLYHEHDAWLNVSPGIAAVGVPFRLWAWPEISIITLNRLN